MSAGAKRPLSVIGGNFVRGMTVRDVRLVRYSEVRGVRISEVEMYGVHAVVGRGHAGCPLQGGCPLFGVSIIGGSTVVV